MDNNKKPVDYYDKIADALEIISGNDSHINDEDKNMDYYKRIAEALENIAESGGGGSSGGGSENPVFIITNNNGTLDKTYNEIKDKIMRGYMIYFKIPDTEYTKDKYTIDILGIEDRILGGVHTYVIEDYSGQNFVTLDPDDYPVLNE